MINGIQGAGYAYQPVPSNNPRQGEPAPADASPLQPPLARVGSAAPARPPQSPALTVRPGATVLDTLPWNTKANVAGIESRIVVGKEKSGDARLGYAQVPADPRIVLSPCAISHTPTPRQQETARRAAIDILTNTEQKYNLNGTPAGRLSAEHRAWLEQSPDSLTVGKLASMMQSVSEAVHAQEMGKLGPSHAERTAGRMPMDCMTHFAHQLAQSGKGATAAQNELINDLKRDVQSRVMRHELTFDATRQWLANAATRCEHAGLGHLAKWATQLRAAIPAAPLLRNVATALHDNVHGRALESLLIDRLVQNPPAAVRASMAALGNYLAQTLSDLPAVVKQDAAKEVQKLARHEPRSWQGQSPQLMAFVQADPDHALDALRALLSAPKHTGADCLAIPYLTVKLSTKLVEIASTLRPASIVNSDFEYAPWMGWANANYGYVVGPASARATQTAPNENRITPKAGITSHHQPIAVPTHPTEAAMHPGDRNLPLLDHPSVALNTALEHGVPFVSGVSGSTNIVMHAVGYMRHQGVPIDAKDALLATMMFLTHDGGHSMHEAMWVANQLDHAWSLGIGMADPAHAPDNFVADYEAFIASFPQETRPQLEGAAESAWSETIRSFGQHSHFATQQLTP